MLLHRFFSLSAALLCTVHCLFYGVNSFAQPAVSQYDKERLDSLENHLFNNPTLIDEVTVVGGGTKVISGPGGEYVTFATSVSEVLQHYPGVQIKDFGGVGGVKTVNVRGLGSHHVGVFYDGVQLGNAQNGVVDLGRFSVENVEAISLFSGDRGAIFQSAKELASSNSLYIQTRRPSFQRSNYGYNLNLGVKIGSFDTYNPTVLFEHKPRHNLSYSLAGEWITSSGEYPFRRTMMEGYDTVQIRQNGDIEALRVEGGLWLDTRRGTVNGKIFFYNSERGYPGAVVRGYNDTYLNEDRQWDTNVFAQIIANQRFSDWYSLRVTSKLAYDYLRYLSDTELNSSAIHVDNSYYQKEAYLSAAHLFSINRYFGLSYATDVQANTLDANLLNFAYPTRYTLLNAASAAVDYNIFHVRGSLLHTYVHDKTRYGTAAAERALFSPTVQFFAEPLGVGDNRLIVKALYKDTFRMPSLNDLYYTTVGNVELNPERARQYLLGVSSIVRSSYSFLQLFETEFNTYFNQVDDKIIAVPTSNQFRWMMTNLGYTETVGAEATMSGRVRARIARRELIITPRVSYTFQHAADLTDSESDYYGGQIPYIPRHSGSAIMGVAYRDMSLNYSFLYNGERYTSVANIPENYLEPWYTHDLSLGYRWRLQRCEVGVTAEVNNLLDQQYEVIKNYPMPGRNYRLKLEFKLLCVQNYSITYR